MGPQGSFRDSEPTVTQYSENPRWAISANVGKSVVKDLCSKSKVCRSAAFNGSRRPTRQLKAPTRQPRAHKRAQSPHKRAQSPKKAAQSTHKRVQSTRKVAQSTHKTAQSTPKERQEHPNPAQSFLESTHINK